MNPVAREIAFGLLAAFNESADAYSAERDRLNASGDITPDVAGALIRDLVHIADVALEMLCKETGDPYQTMVDRLKKALDADERLA